MPRPAPIETAADLINALGGTTQVSAFLQVIPSAVSNAKAADRIPEAWRFRLAELAKQKGIKNYEPVLRRDLAPLGRKARREQAEAEAAQEQDQTETEEN